jgi:hypothetical protein
MVNSWVRNWRTWDEGGTWGERGHDTLEKQIGKTLKIVIVFGETGFRVAFDRAVNHDEIKMSTIMPPEYKHVLRHTEASCSHTTYIKIYTVKM